MKRIVYVLAVVIALAALFFYGLTRGRPDRDVRSNLLDRPVPTFALPLHAPYIDEYGETFVMADYLGTPMVINFWASWCPPCYREAPRLEAAWQEYRDRVLFIGIQTQDKGKQVAGLDFVEQFSLSFPNLIDDNSRVSIEYGLFGVPETFFIRADGTLSHKHAGELTSEVLQTQIAELLQ